MPLRFSAARFLLAALAGGIFSLTSPASGQVRNRTPTEDVAPVLIDSHVTRTPDINAGKVGQRQTRADVVSDIGVDPMARINNRIANRVQSRLRNRIDKDYDPQANATSPFLVAQEQARGVRRR